MNNRITEILENLAILHQALQNGQENVDTIDVLGKIKLLSAQLYLEADMEIITSNNPEVEEMVLDTEDDVPVFNFEIDNSVEPDVQPTETVFEEEESEAKVIEFDIEPSIEVETTTPSGTRVIGFEYSINSNPPAPVDVVSPEPEPEPLPEPEPDPEPEIIPEVEVEPEPVIEIPQKELQFSQPETETAPAPTNASKPANEVISQFSLTRRYEFVNFLFGGDLNRFTVFIEQMMNAPDADGREDVFDKWYDENLWRRKDESASELKRSLRKIFAQ